MLLKNLVITAILASASWFSSMAQAAPLTFNVDGVITNSNNQPLEAAAVTFRIDVKDSAETCLLYREDFLLSMTGSNGYFSIVVGKTPNLVFGGSALDKVFSNQAVIIPGQSCTYTPASVTETRKVVVSFNDGTGAQVFNTQEIQSVPFALQAQAVNGYGTGDLLKVAPTVSQTTNSNSDLSQTQYDEFWRLVKNPLAAYLPTTGDVTLVAGNNKVTSILGQALPAGPATNGQVLVSNGTTWALQAMNTGSVLSVSGTAPIAVGGTATAPVISIPAATTSKDGYLTSADWNSFSAKQSSALASGNLWVGNASGAATAVSMSGDATMGNTGAVTLKSIGTPGAYYKVTTDAQGRVTAGANLVSSDITTALGYTPVNKAGDTMGGALAMGGFDITNAGNITMAASKTLGLSSNATDPGAPALGQIWYNSTSNQIKYFNGTAVQALGIAGAGITSLNGATGSAQTFVTGTAGTDFNISLSANAHSFNFPSSSASTRGLLTSADWTAFNTKLGTTLTNSKIWVGNASNVATEQTLSGDITAVSNTGAVTVDKTQAAVASKILQLTANSVAVTKGTDIGGAGAGVASLRYPSTAANTTLTLPNGAGLVNQFLQTDGAGVLMWAAPAASSITGTLPITNGGTGLTSFSNYSVVTSSSSGALQSTTGTVPGSPFAYTVTGPNYTSDLLFGMAATPANYVLVTGSASTFAPTIAATGADANVSLSLSAKGNGNVKVDSSYVERAPAFASVSSTYTIPTGYNIARVTLIGNATVILPTPPSGLNQVFSLTVKVKQDATGSRALGWASSGTEIIKWDGASLAVPAMAPGAETIYQFLYFDTENIWYASQTWKEQ